MRLNFTSDRENMYDNFSVKSTDRQVASGQGATGVGQPLSQSSAAGGAQYDVGRFRASVQALVQCAAPLGGSMDFLLEDAETMAAELRKWEDEARRYKGIQHVCKGFYVFDSMYGFVT